MEWMMEVDQAGIDRKCQTIFPYQVRGLYRATTSRSARKAMKLNYVLNDAQWNRLTTEYSDYLREHGNRPKLSTRQLGLLDKLQDSRLARVLLRARSPATPWWWRAVQRKHSAMLAGGHVRHQGARFQRGPDLPRIPSCEEIGACEERARRATDNTRCSPSCSWRADLPQESCSRSICRHPSTLTSPTWTYARAP